MALKRGSEVLAKRLGRPAELSAKQLGALVATAEAASARILNWEIYGKPGIDRLRASFAVGPDQLVTLVEKLVRTKTRFNWEVFPEGVPPLIDQFRVDLKQGF
jgi:hypothetical protein